MKRLAGNYSFIKKWLDAILLILIGLTWFLVSGPDLLDESSGLDRWLSGWSGVVFPVENWDWMGCNWVSDLIYKESRIFKWWLCQNSGIGLLIRVLHSRPVRHYKCLVNVTAIRPSWEHVELPDIPEKSCCVFVLRHTCCLSSCCLESRFRCYALASNLKLYVLFLNI